MDTYSEGMEEWGEAIAGAELERANRKGPNGCIVGLRRCGGACKTIGYLNQTCQE